jgi:predicted  nucleic acid-binding Zn-ribbon protein
MATTSQNSINSSTSTQNSSADYEMNIEDKTIKIGEYFDKLLKLRLDWNEIDLKISKKNYKLYNLSDSERETRESTLTTEIVTLRRNRNKKNRQIEKLNTKIEKKMKEIKNEIENLDKLENVNKFRRMIDNIQERSKLKRTTQSNRTGFNSMHIDLKKKSISKIESKMKSVKDELDDLFRTYKNKTKEFIDIKKKFYEEVVRLEDVDKTMSDRFWGRRNFEFNHTINSNNSRERLNIIKGIVKNKTKELQDIEREIEEKLKEEQDLISKRKEEYNEMNWGGRKSIKNKYKAKKNNRKTMKRSR